MLRTDLCLPAEQTEPVLRVVIYLFKVLMVYVISAPETSQQALGHHCYFECIWGITTIQTPEGLIPFYIKKERKSIDIEQYPSNQWKANSRINFKATSYYLSHIVTKHDQKKNNDSPTADNMWWRSSPDLRPLKWEPDGLEISRFSGCTDIEPELL